MEKESDQDEDPGIDLDISEPGDEQDGRGDSLDLGSLTLEVEAEEDLRERVAKAETQRDQAMSQWEELLQQLLAAEAEKDEEKRLREEAEQQLRTVQSRLRVHEQKTAARQRSEAQGERLEGKVRDLEGENERLRAELAAARALSSPPSPPVPRCETGDGEVNGEALARAEREIDALLVQNAELVAELESLNERLALVEGQSGGVDETGRRLSLPKGGKEEAGLQVKELQSQLSTAEPEADRLKEAVDVTAQRAAEELDERLGAERVGEYERQIAEKSELLAKLRSASSP